MDEFIDIKNNHEYKENVKNDNKLYVIYFSTECCTACHLAEPSVIRLTKKYKNVTFIRIKVRIRELYTQFSIRQFPTYILVTNNREIARVIGTKIIDLDKEINRNYMGLTRLTSKLREPITIKNILDELSLLKIDVSSCLEKEDLLNLARMNGIL